MEIKEKPPDDFFKGIKTSLKSVLKHPDINLPKNTIVTIIFTLVFYSKWKDINLLYYVLMS